MDGPTFILIVRLVKDKHHVISLLCGIKKKDTNELTFRIETDSQTLKTKLWLQKWKGAMRNGLGVWDWHMHTEVYGMIGQWGPAV